ncbi:hypothetical protein IW261DRAFT_12492 [Armillaria novae-zelandiae]|uniref:Uncharacterized protein n=1 Tax=Armillaria novae-zelandiae TaxID=153914 RepID=A0AA39UJK6_9AGAR|nr:hypothetical protein IW261DRAFT_12492 [Armillaria novae-zelandiae]
MCVWGGCDVDYYHVPSVGVLMRQVGALPDKGGAFEDWYEDKKADLMTIESLGEQCEAWMAARSWARKVELGRVRQRRVDDVIGKLKELGWEFLIDRIPRKKIASHKLVAYSRPLTDRSTCVMLITGVFSNALFAGWRRMEPAMVEFMKELQERNERGITVTRHEGDNFEKAFHYEMWTLDGEHNTFGPFDRDTRKLSDVTTRW